jgi:hypothetical protein
MWTKDFYQETMLGYLDGVEAEIEALEQTRVTHGDLIELYENLDIALERLWRVIRASDADWEQFRFPLEANCEDLLRGYYRVLHHSRRLKPRWS